MYPAVRSSHREIGAIGGHPFVKVAAAGLSAAASRHAEPLTARLDPLAFNVDGDLRE